MVKIELFIINNAILVNMYKLKQFCTAKTHNERIFLEQKIIKWQMLKH